MAGYSTQFTVVDSLDAQPVNAAIAGWDAVAHSADTITRRYAQSTPFSLISRRIDFRSAAEGGLSSLLCTVASQIPLYTFGSGSNASSIMVIPTMVGLMIHPNSASVPTAMTGCLIISGALSPAAGERNITDVFSLQSSGTYSNTVVSSGINGGAIATTALGAAGSVVRQGAAGSATVPATLAGIRGHYYLCPINRGFLGVGLGATTANLGGCPLRGMAKLDAAGGFVGDGALVANHTYMTTTTYDTISLYNIAGGGNVAMSIIDLYGMIIPSTA